MSYNLLSQTSTSKLSLPDTDDDPFLQEIPSSFDLALNGNTDLSSPYAQKQEAYPPSFPPTHSTSPYTKAPPFHSRIWHTTKCFYNSNEPLLRVAFSQLFGALMNATTRLLELEGGEDGMHPFQILFLRQGLTMTLVTTWLWWKRIEGFPLGNPGVRRWLVARSICGFWGIFGMYCESKSGHISLRPSCRFSRFG